MSHFKYRGLFWCSYKSLKLMKFRDKEELYSFCDAHRVMPISIVKIERTHRFVVKVVRVNGGRGWKLGGVKRHDGRG